MPSEDSDTAQPGPYRARCYCGASHLGFGAAPRVVSYCHCGDCRRWTGAPVAAFAGFATEDLQTDLGPGLSVNPGVTRWNCRTCGSPLAASFDYLPDQLYVPLGILDAADRLPPQLHSHAENALPWLHLGDALPRATGSARTQLREGEAGCH